VTRRESLKHSQLATTGRCTVISTNLLSLPLREVPQTTTFEECPKEVLDVLMQIKEFVVISICG
jgi:hypothetical protein